MKILAVGRNYAAHIEELANEKPTEPVIFMKPDTAVLRNNAPFYYPEFTTEIHHELEIVIRIGKEGKHIAPKFAAQYIDGIALGIDFTARDIQNKLKEKSLPWTLAKGFDGSAPISEVLPIADFPNLKNISFTLFVNDQLRQEGNTALMIYDFATIISFISKYITLRKGDLIFTGTPQGVAPIAIGDRLTGYLENKKMFDFEIK
jgi:2-keto-4-pentenoate hydratase/2-oxohepta-3-ene-1,7-dioic acid hydratase in catechol pathway